MAQTLLLSSTWDLTLDASGNIAVADDDLSLAQDAASAIKTFLGECYWDVTLGVAYSNVFGKVVPLPLLKQMLVNAALSISSEIASAQVFITAFDSSRAVSGQVQVISTTGELTAANFTVINPQGPG